MKITRLQLEAQRPQLPAGFVDEFLAMATPCHGVWLVMPDEDYAVLRRKYWPNPPQKMRGAGDLIARVLKPVVRFVDAVAGTDLEHCKECGKRQEKMNKAIPFTR